MHLLNHPILLLLIPVGFIAGLVDGIAGGGGLLTLPALMMTGIPPQTCLGTNKLSNAMGVFASSFTYIRKGLLKPAIWQTAIIATLLGAATGAIMTHIVSAHFFRTVVPIIILCAAIYMLIPKKFTLEKPEFFKPKNLSSALLGTTLGFYDGFLGPGTGSFWTTLVIAVYKLDLVTASGVARFMNFVSSSVALITFIILSSVDYKVGFAMGSAFMLGSYIGANSAIRYGAGFIKPIFLVVVMAIAIKMAWTEWHII